MTQIKTKRVYEPYGKEDGARILVDKLWPRGIKKEKLKYDIWAKDIGPSKQLREWFHEDKAGNWKKFKSRYSRELEASGAVSDLVEKIKRHKTVTLIYAAKDQEHNHVLILRPLIEKQLKD
jgi:uncharacterized protein YeaO (DUF488 family)